MIAARCPTAALEPTSAGLDVNLRRCVHCFRCVRGTNSPLNWSHGYECANLCADNNDRGKIFNPSFSRSLHILVVDAGDCGACLNEVKQLNNPYYNMHRLGFFLTPTPRHADALLVVGALTEHMRLPLRKAYDAMPTPKRVIAVGVCALSGGVFGRSFMCAGGVGDFLPVDVEVPGNPPPPLAILHGLLVVAGRKPPAPQSRIPGDSVSRV
jgi:Ni,Fe-hydrogenase III small subunit